MSLRQLLFPGLLAVTSLHLAPAGVPTDPPRSSAWLSRLPDGELKRRFILDCTGCHHAVDGKRGAVWAAYGASPGIPARVARVQPE